MTEQTDQRVCVTCGLHITRETATRYRHLDFRADADHQAQPKLAHPMDADAFAGLE